MSHTQGTSLLKQLVSPPVTQAVTQATIARALGVTPQAVSQWVRGTAAPDRENAVALNRLYNIPIASWAEPPKDVPTNVDEPAISTGAAA